MTIYDIYEKHLKPENLIPYFAKYELYYQISLGHYVYRTTLDINETITKLEELNLKVDAHEMIETLKDLLEHFSHIDEFENNFEYYIKQRACLQSLADFSKSDKDLVNPQIFIDATSDAITNDTFFNESMRIQFDTELENQLVRWNQIMKFKV